MLTITIDWLAGTFRSFTNEAESFIRAYASAETVQTARPRNGYSIAQMDNNGVQLLWNSNDNRMGHHIVFSGSSLRNLFERTNLHVVTLLRASVDAGMRISRLDLAKDCTERAIDGQAIYQLLKSRTSGGTALNISRIENAQGGQTIYVGSRQSERFVRCYDKAQETGDTSKLWWRLEVEAKGDVARLLADAIATDIDLNSAFDAIVKRMVGNPSEVGLDEFFSAKTAPFGLPKIEKQTDREKWISEQVISAIAKHYIDNPNSEAIAALRHILDTIDRQRKL